MTGMEELNIADSATSCAQGQKRSCAQAAPGVDVGVSCAQAAPGVDEAAVAAAVRALAAGKAVVFPTDTVYGVGVAVDSAASPQAIYAAKRRDANKAIPWLVGSAKALDLYGRDASFAAHALAQRFWPGPLTLIVQASGAVPAAFRAQDGTVALRMPNDPVALSLIKRVGSPLATSSANFQGERPPRTLSQVDASFAAQVAYVLGDGAPRSGISSTIVDCTDEALHIVREGVITAAEIESAL